MANNNNKINWQQRAKEKKLNRFSQKWGMPMETGQDQMDALILMNELKNLAKDFESPETALGGLEMWGGGSASDKGAEMLFSILRDKWPWEKKMFPNFGTSGGTPYNITDITELIGEGKQWKDDTNGWDVGGYRPDYDSTGGGTQREPEKMQGIMALLQRLLPGGKTGYR